MLLTSFWIMEFTSSGGTHCSANENTILLSRSGVHFPMPWVWGACDLLRPTEGGRSDIAWLPSPGPEQPCLLGMLLQNCMERNPASLRDLIAREVQTSPLSPAASSPSAECLHVSEPAGPAEGLPGQPTERSGRKMMVLSSSLGLVCYSAVWNWNSEVRE